jgi:5-formaminoimidazole-4-carboxamide-1-beta-D-ribofuranosyl 5'-monophosphate synthetase
MAEKSLNALVNCVNKAEMMYITISMGKNINLDVVFYDIYGVIELMAIKNRIESHLTWFI